MRKIVVPAFILVLTFYLIFLFLRTSDDPEFCASCHFMKPFYDNWASSTHNTVPCGKCHYGPAFSDYLKGKVRLFSEIVRYYIGVYSHEIKTIVKDEACLQCHRKDEFLTQQISFASGERILNFRHESHFSKEKVGFELKCQNCHSELVQGRHEAISSKVCVLCHFVGADFAKAKRSECGVCHGPPKDEINIWGTPFNHSEYLKSGISCNSCHLHVTVGRGDVRSEKCLDCHIQVPERRASVEEMHSIHVSGQNVKCLKCHDEIVHGKVEIFQAVSPTCQNCHGNQHSVQERIYAGTGGKGVATLPDLMFISGVTCQACHRIKFKREITGVIFELPKASPETCRDCHGFGFDRLLERWQTEVKRRLDVLSVEYKWASLIKSFKSKRDVDEALINLELVQKDGSYGAHNIRYVHLLLNEVENKLGVNFRKPSVELIYRTSSRCLNCHFGIESASSNTGSKRFEHGVHLLTLSCANCHVQNEPLQKNHGALLVEAKSCNNCHHRDLTKGCESCHTMVGKFYAGEFLADSPDVMKEAGLSCTDCHSVNSSEIERPTPSICGNCHDENYVKDYEAKKLKIESLIARWDDVFPKIVDSFYAKGYTSDDLKKLKNTRDEIENFRKVNFNSAHNLLYGDEFIRRVEAFLKDFK